MWLADELVSCLTGGLNDGLVVLKDSVREVVSAQVLPDIFNRVQFGRLRRQQYDVEVLRYFKFTSGVPPCSVHEHGCVSFDVNLFADFVEVQLHGLGLSSLNDQSSTYTTLWADGPEQISVL